jgi:hypothetical protein
VCYCFMYIAVAAIAVVAVATVAVYTWCSNCTTAVYVCCAVLYFALLQLVSVELLLVVLSIAQGNFECADYRSVITMSCCCYTVVA